jgi:hypothetical protein
MRGLVVQQALPPALVAKDELAGEEHRARKPQMHVAAKALQLGDGFGAERAVAIGGPTHARACELDVLLEVAVDLLLQRSHFLLALERARIDHSDGNEHDLLELIREHARNLKQRMNSEATEAACEHDSRRLRRIELGRWRRCGGNRFERQLFGKPS